MSDIRLPTRKPASLTASLVFLLLPFVLLHSTASAVQPNNAFNPSIGLILNGTYGSLSSDPEQYSIAGFPLAEESDPGTQGFALGESELGMHANIDPDWYGSVTLGLESDGGASVENAYIQSTSLGHGLTLKAGRFFSGVGYLNQQHPHSWDFSDTALAYRALLGTQYSDDGVQLRWLAPVDMFTEFGAEWMRGDSFPAGGSANDGQGAWSAFVHVGDDVGQSNSWSAGLSYLSADAVDRETSAADFFSGSSEMMIVDFVWKWAPKGNADNKNFKFQAEYIRSKNDGTFTPDGGVATPYSATPEGWYMQAVYQFMPHWRIGLRQDQLNAGNAGTAFNGSSLDDQGHTASRSSIMLDYSRSEFSRFRLQYNYDQSQPEPDEQWFIQYIVSIGAHGAHIF